jgi:hypothetical protein
MFTIAWVVHLAVWRVRVPRPATSFLLWIFIGALPVGIAVGWLGVGLGAWQIVQASLFHAAASFAYIIIYAGIEEPSPTLVIVRAVHRAGTDGCRIEDLTALLTDAAVVDGRLDALHASGLVEPVADAWRLTPRGIRLAWLMQSFAERVLRLPKGG